MRNSGRKITVLALGLLAGLIALEVSLRVIGVAYSCWMQEGHIAKREPGTFVVLCVGDSFTEGAGVTPGRGYPSQLQELLRKQYPEKKIRVVNKGVGASNTTMILEKFDTYADTVDPDLVIILAGCANNWNAYGYGNYLKRNSLANRLHDFFYGIKTFKLIKLFTYEIKNKHERQGKRRMRHVSPEAVEWNHRGLAYESEGKYDEAIHCFNQALEKDPSYPETYAHVAKIHSRTGNQEEARRIYRRLLKENPRNYRYFSAFTSTLKWDSVAPEDQEDIRFIQEYANADPAVEDILKAAKDGVTYQREAGAWVSHDVEEMIQRAQRRGMKVIIQNYPYYYAPVGYINASLKEVAEKSEVPFINNEKVFERLFLEGERRDDYFSFDKEHCNEKGYRIMAENVNNCIFENGFMN